ncbi:hypothetical protein [Ensifer sp. YR511]|uniref:virion core protein, T7 gp14 family n=1 Tax=Ensifer sp. YR511 TaxID=1855294 RepID=UPI00088FC5E5|nr:hypothetical protein [Ensifer sp. YR511]SDM28822.1 hypothetical protein SAMN05216328_107291 [Ensifer sp. YR511]
MCDPFSVIGMGLSIATQGIAYRADAEAASQTNQLYRENAKRANENARQQMFDTQQRMIQEQEAGAAEKIDTMREAREARATAEAAAGEANVSGLSVEALMREFSGREASFNDRVDQNTDWSMRQLNNEMKGIRANAEDRINSVQRAAKPSFFDAGLRIAGAGLSSYSDYKDRQWKAAQLAHR